MKARTLFVFATIGALAAACGSSSSPAAPAAGASGSSGAAGASAGGASAGGTNAGGSSAGGNATGGVSAGGAGGGTDVAAACQAQAVAMCAKRDQCENQLGAREFGSDAACVTRLTLSCTTSLAAPGQGNTGTAVSSCTQSIMAATCADWLAPAGVCPQQKGTGVNGSACVYPGQCSSGYCSNTPGAACGVCADLPKAGDACSTTCGAQALDCNRTAMKCVPVVGAGEKCDDGASCGPGLDCVGFVAKTMTSGVCQAFVVTSGAACDPAGVMGPRCDRNAGLACDKATMKCVAIATATAGQPCGTDKTTGAITECGGASVCVGAKGAGTCTAYAMEGAACDTSAGPACLPPASCITSGGATSGMCQLPMPAACK